MGKKLGPREVEVVLERKSVIVILRTSFSTYGPTVHSLST